MPSTADLTWQHRPGVDVLYIADDGAATGQNGGIRNTRLVSGLVGGQGTVFVTGSPRSDWSRTAPQREPLRHNGQYAGYPRGRPPTVLAALPWNCDNLAMLQTSNTAFRGVAFCTDNEAYGQLHQPRDRGPMTNAPSVQCHSRNVQRERDGCGQRRLRADHGTTGTPITGVSRRDHVRHCHQQQTAAEMGRDPPRSNRQTLDSEQRICRPRR